MAVVPDQVAIDIENFGKPVVAFCGWVSAADAQGFVRIYDRNTFDDFIELNENDVVAQIVGADDPDRGLRSAIWVDATAPLKIIRSGTAAYFFETEQQRTVAGDPSGGYGGKGGSGRP